jgi:hypothetical protein
VHAHSWRDVCQALDLDLGRATVVGELVDGRHLTQETIVKGQQRVQIEAHECVALASSHAHFHGKAQVLGGGRHALDGSVGMEGVVRVPFAMHGDLLVGRHREKESARIQW